MDITKLYIFIFLVLLIYKSLDVYRSTCDIKIRDSLELIDGGLFVIRILGLVGHCPLSQICFMYTMFRVLALLPSSGDWLSLY
jgi:hypothetical protein